MATNTQQHQIRNTYEYGASNYASNQLAVQRANTLLPDLATIPVDVTINGLTFQARAELALLIQATLGENFNLTDTQLKRFHKSGTMRQGVAMPGFTGAGVADTRPEVTVKLSSAEALKQAIKQAIIEQVSKFNRFLELSCQDALDNPAAILSKIAAGESITLGKIKTVGVTLEDLPSFLNGLDLPLDRIKALALSEKYSDMLKLMMEDLASYKPSNPRPVDNCLLVDCILTEGQVETLEKSGTYALTSKKDSTEALALADAIKTLTVTMPQLAHNMQSELNKLNSTYIVSKAI